MQLDADPIQAAWTRYHQDADIEARNELMVHYASLVRHIAAKVAATLPSSVDRGDLVSYGMFGLVDAIARFDPEAGTKFETYAVIRIRGHIIDEMRQVDWVPRSIRSKAREIERASEAAYTRLGRPPSETELAEEMEISLAELAVLRSETLGGQIETLDDTDNAALGSEDGGMHTPQMRLRDVSANPEDMFARQEIVEMIARAVSGMEERSRRIILLSYFEELTLREIGIALGVTESRVCQLQSKALGELSNYLTEGLG